MHARLIHFKPDPTWVPFYVCLIFSLPFMLRLAAPKTTTAAPGLSRRCCRHRAQPPSTSGGVVVVTLDVVVYPFAPPSCVRTVGVVTDVDGDDVTISQLERELPDDGGSDADACWLISETEEEVVCHADEVLVIASDYGQRCDMDR